MKEIIITVKAKKRVAEEIQSKFAKAKGIKGTDNKLSTFEVLKIKQKLYELAFEFDGKDKITDTHLDLFQEVFENEPGIESIESFFTA